MLEEYIKRLREKELVYKEGVVVESGMVLLDEAIKILIEMDVELTTQFLKTKL